MSLLIFFLVTFVIPLILIRKSGYCAAVMLGWDLLGSALTGGRAGETLSGRTGSSLVQGKFKGHLFAPVIDFLMRRKGHCVDAIKGDQMRAEAVLQDYAKLTSKP